MLYAEVAVNSTFPHRDTFSYSIPADLRVQPGSGVYVPFGRLTLQGIVVEVHDTPVFSAPEKIRPIRSGIGTTPLLDEPHIALAKWIAHYYIAPIFDAVALMLPPGFERKPRTIVRPLVDASEIDGLGLTERQRSVLAAAISARAHDLDSLRERLEFSNTEAVLAQLERRGLVVREYGLARPQVSAKMASVAALKVAAPDARAHVEAGAPPRRSRRADLVEQLLTKRYVPVPTAARIAGGRANLQRLVLAGAVRHDRNGDNIELAASPLEAAEEIRRLRQGQRARQALDVIGALQHGGAEDVASLRARLHADTATLRWLEELGVMTLGERAVERDPLQDLQVTPRPRADLLPAQQLGADAICATVDAHRHRTFLLHGVTGSGKTEVYLHALDRCVASGRRGIVMVPEIALTPQTVRRFRERFERVAVLHSGVSAGELFDQWHGIAAGRYDVVVGARSAIFAPLPDLGLVVIDEEHEWTYKQHDASPRYHARDVGIELASSVGATVVLGSATPDVCSFERAERGEYTLVTLPERIRPVFDTTGSSRPVASPAMPAISVVDMREELRAGRRSMFSAELRDAVDEALAADGQVILFLNRRGLAGHVQCRDCGFVPVCSSCDVAMTFHRQYDRLVCHQCNRRLHLPTTCRECGSPRVRLMGAGVEKVEAEAAQAFPHARLLRWDRDATRGRHAHERILAAFLAHEADILIGTQMLAKGLDMPAVTVVGVVSADVGLHLPEFRAGERVFQLLTQVAGRAGRGERPGRVIIQTYTPEHPAVDAASRYDYEGFAGAELDARRRDRYPPFARLVRLLFAHSNPRFARDEAVRVHRALAQRRAELGVDVDILGPSPAYVPRVRGRWRWQMILRGGDPASLVQDFTFPPQWIVDVDPASLV